MSRRPDRLRFDCCLRLRHDFVYKWDLNFTDFDKLIQRIDTDEQFYAWLRWFVDDDYSTEIPDVIAWYVRQRARAIEAEIRARMRGSRHQ